MTTIYRYAPGRRTISTSNDHMADTRKALPEYSTDNGRSWQALREAPQTVQATCLHALYRDEDWRFVPYSEGEPYGETPVKPTFDPDEEESATP